MKHAIIILAHNDPKHLKRLIAYFDKDCYVLVHIDTKANFSDEYIQELIKMPQVIRVYRKYSIHWGGFSILKCELFMFKEALSKTDASYFHLLSGHDYPIKPLNYFLNFFEDNNGSCFLKYVQFPNLNWGNATFDRFKYYYPYDFVKDARKSKYIKIIMAFQRKMHLLRCIPYQYDILYGASQWCSLERMAVEEIICQSSKSFYRRMRFVFAPDEVYIPTVLCNNSKIKIINDNKRIIIWNQKQTSSPIILTEKFFRSIVGDESLFVRKVDSVHSEKLLRYIDSYLIKNSSIEIMENGGWNYNGLTNYCFDKSLCANILNYIKVAKLSDGIDIGCGSGMYVYQLREFGFPIIGYDANPHTEHLSKLILHANDTPCYTMDITEDICFEEKYDLVLCLDVLSYIPSQLQKKALIQMTKLCAKSIILSIQRDKESIMGKYYIHDLQKRHFYINESFSNFFNQGNNAFIYYILERRNDY